MKIINQMEPLYGKEEKEAVDKYLNSGAWLMEHKKTRELEQIMCNITKAKYACMVPNGTLSLIAGLKALGVKPGDEVIIPDYTIIASATCASFIGAKPVLCDVEMKSGAIDPIDLANKITGKTKAIILVGINGRQPYSWDTIFEIAKENQVPILEDSAQCLGSYYDCGNYKQHMGTMGKIGSFSFSISKIVTMGNGGTIITNDKEIYNELKFMKNFGRLKGGIDKNFYPGIDLKFNDVLATIGIEQLKKLKQRIKRKKEIFKLYRYLLDGFVDFFDTDLKITSPWMSDILLRNKVERAKVIAYLDSKKIGTRKFYPAIHTQKAYNIKGNFPNAVEISERGLWLPSSLKLTNDEIEYVCKEIKKGLK